MRMEKSVDNFVLQDTDGVCLLYVYSALFISLSLSTFRDVHIVRSSRTLSEYENKVSRFSFALHIISFLLLTRVHALIDFVPRHACF